MPSLKKFCLRFLGRAIFVIFALSPSTELLAAEVRLAWRANTDPGLAGYKLYYGKASRRYDTSVCVGNTTTYTLDTLRPGAYFMALTARDTSGNETWFSKELSLTIPPDATFTHVILSAVAENSVTINWTTKMPSKGIIEYGKTVLDEVSPKSAVATNHETQLTGLTPSTLYYYRVTATSTSGDTTTSDLLTFKTSDTINQLAKPSSQAIFIPSVVQGRKFRTNLGINNLSPTIANVSITLVNKQGIAVASKTVQVDPRGYQQINGVAFFLAGTKLGSEIRGTLYLESDQPIYAWTSQIENTTNDPSLLASRRTGATRILIPSAANTSSFASSLTLMNVGSSTAFVAIKAHSTEGSLLGQSAAPLIIPGNGSLWFENILQVLGVTNNYGPLEITSLNNIPFVASSRVSSAAKVGGTFEGFNDAEASMIQIIPTVVDTLELRTNLGINNATEQTASVIIRLINQDGLEVGATAATVVPKGLTQINNIAQQLLSRSEVTNFQGYVRLESDQPIFSWASIIDNFTNDPGFALSKSMGSTKVLIESATNGGSFKSGLVVVNMGDAEAEVDIVAYDNAGEVSGELLGLAIHARGYFTSDNILGRLGVSNGFGPIKIISVNGQPIIATSRVYSTSGTGGFFEGRGVDVMR